MKLWTVQKREIIEMIKNNGMYQPDFKKSDYVQESPELGDLYNMLLQSFNKLNDVNVPGLIYAFAKADDRGEAYEIKDFDEFYALIQDKSTVIQRLWDTLQKRDTVIAELDCEVDFNPILMDINDFQFAMPPIMLVPPFTEQDIDRIRFSIMNGQLTRSTMPSGIIQVHLPFIKSENITNVYAMFELEDSYADDLGMGQNYLQALEQLCKGAEQSDLIDHYMQLGNSYYTGNGVEQDYEQAFMWYRKAAEQGDAVAQCNIGDLYKMGQGVDQDYGQALLWYRKAAEQGNVPAQNNLGLMYITGTGVERDYRQAFKWYRKAAEQGNVFAQYNLGMQYMNGDGVEQDYEQAYKWFEKAADQGDADAWNMLKVLHNKRN